MKKLFQLMNVCILSVIFGVLLSNPLKAQCSFPGVTEDFETLNGIFDNFKVYPSLAPRVYVKISYNSFVDPEFFDPNSLSNSFICHPIKVSRIHPVPPHCSVLSNQISRRVRSWHSRMM